MKKIIWFRTDRLGDFIINSHLIKAMSEKSEDIYTIVVCSPINKELIKEYEFIDEVIIYDKSLSLIKKVGLVLQILSNKYEISIAIDGKSISYLCSALIRSKNKIGILYKKRIKILNFIKFTKYKPLIFKKLSQILLFHSTVEISSKDSLEHEEHLPTICIESLNKFNLGISSSSKYIFPFKEEYDSKIKTFLDDVRFNDYLLFHLDDKWNDIKNFSIESVNFFKNIQISTNKKIILTSFNYDSEYLNFLKDSNEIIKFSKNYQISYPINKNIILIENSSLFEFERLIYYSQISISCHSGFLVQVSGANHSNVIDIINENDSTWIDCWVPKNTNYDRIFKTKKNKKIPINELSEQLIKKIV